MDFELTARQRAIQELARDFRERFVDALDQSAEYTVTDPGPLPLAPGPRGVARGLRTLAVPESGRRRRGRPGGAVPGG